MAEYIERRAALREAKYAAVRGLDPVAFVEDVPVADVAPVVHGRWEPGNPICPVCGGDKFKDLDADIWCDRLPNYCPNCGAKMDGGDSDEVD